DEGWHVYSQYTPKGGPFPPLVTFKKSPSYSLERKTREVGIMERTWAEGIEIGTLFYKERVDVVQLVKLNSEGPVTGDGTVEFMACTNEQCVPPEEVESAISLDKAPR